MFNDKASDKSLLDSASLAGAKLESKTKASRLSLKLHTMPRTSDSHFKKWLILGILMAALMVLIAFLVLW
ncbi:MAG: hypothetical protein WC545_01135 [Patescibacteria group bacterium]